MSGHLPSHVRTARLSPLAHCIALIVAGTLPAASALAANVVVTSCGDAVGDAGSLRSKIAGAASGAVVDLSALICADSTITLAQGAIPVTVTNLTIAASSANHFSISGNNADRVFRHTGAGTLTLSDLTIEKGSYVTPEFAQPGPQGGCIYATGGSVALIDSTITLCSITNDTHRTGHTRDGSRGGAIGAPEGSVSLTRSTVSFNFVNSVDTQYSTGGGGISAHVLTAVGSLIEGNIAIPGSMANSFGGGVLVETAIVSNTAIVDNNAVFGGGLYIEGGTSSSSIVNSTISGNGGRGGGICSRNPLSLINTTVALNTGPVGSGLYQMNSTVTMQSSIVADNSDVYGTRNDIRLSSATIAGSHNLITDMTNPLPVGTLTDEPRLAPLALHGGTTPVMPLLPTSPALNAGANPNALTFDQRGAGYPRTSGTATDIGAYESRGIHDDELFYDGFSPLD